MISFREVISNGQVHGLLPIFEELRKLLKIPECEERIASLPFSLFRRSLLCNSPQDSVSFIEYAGQFNSLEHKMKTLPRDSLNQLYPDALGSMEALYLQLSKIKQHIYYNCDDNQLQKEVLMELYERETEGRLPSGTEFSRECGYETKKWDEQKLHLYSTS